MTFKLHIDIFQKLKMSTGLAFLLLVLPLGLFSQSGPGGVSNDSDSDRNCRLWLDAGDLASPTQTDGSEVTVWYDKSNSAILDTAIWVETNFGITYSEFFTPPLFRSDPAYSINGRPVVSFEDGGMLLMGLKANAGNNADLVASTDGPAGITKRRTIFIAFRTGNDIATRQFLWEQGGGWRGLGMYIFDSEFYIGVYDIEGAGFGYSYKKTPIQPNTTYVASLVFDVSNVSGIGIDTDVINKSFIGTLNGEAFDTLRVGAAKPSGSFGVGAIKRQGDPIGIGGVNSLVAHESSIYDWDKNNPGCKGHVPCDNSYSETEQFALTGQFRFKGRIAEIAYYAYSLNPAERIIVENYLAAKYFANVIQNDRFQYKSNFGHDVIGIGAEFDTGTSTYKGHNISKGDNLFEMSVDDMDEAFKFEPEVSRYLLVGHNNNPLVWTTQNTPDSANIQRLRRTWRFDRSGDPGDESVKIRFAPSDLPQVPQNYKYAILIDNTNGPLPNFSTSSDLTEIVLNTTTGWYEGDFNIPHGAYFTIAAVKPTIQFKKSTDYAIEGDPSPDFTTKTAEVELNYTPKQTGPIQTGVLFHEDTAVEGDDDDFTYSGTSISIPAGTRTGTIDFNIINDNIPDIPPVKKFLILLDQTVTDTEFFIGKRDTLTYSIYDDDSDPVATFLSANSTITEAAETAQVEVQITGERESLSLVKITDQGTGSAEYGVHYELPSGDEWFPDGGLRSKIIEFEAGSNVSKIINILIFDPEINDYDKTIDFIIEPVDNAVVDEDISILEHTLNIENINPEPIVEFLASNSEGFRVVSQPRIVAKLSAPSGKLIQVPFEITGGSAVNGADQSNSDYTATYSGTLIFQPGDTISYLYYDPETGIISIQVDAGIIGETEPDETIDFKLIEPVVYAELAPIEHLEHTYTIKDYAPFEWEGAAGIGRLRDNTFWINLDVYTVPASPSSVQQLSTRPISIKQTFDGNRPEISLGRNDQNVMKFNGNTDFYEVSGSKKGESPFINTAGFYDSKSIFFVVKPYDVTTDLNTPQVIYEEGGADKGLNIYIKDKRLYFQAWNITDDVELGPDSILSPWGDNASTSLAISNELSNNTTYVVSCHYNNTKLPGSTGDGLRVFINGQPQGTFGSVGRLYVHSEKIGIGGVNDNTRFGDVEIISPTGYNFEGEIGEMIYFNESGYYMNTARIRILHNYLSARFDIDLGSEQIFDLDYANQTNSSPTFNKDVAGIGIVESGNLHATSQGSSYQGSSQLKITAPELNGTDKFLMWGHNGESFTNTWPFSYGNASLPGEVKERSGRVWRFSASGATPINNLTVEMNFSESANALELTNNRDRLRLLVSDDIDDWSSAEVYEIGGTPQPDVAEVGRIIFENVNIPDGAYLALGNTSAITVSPLPIELLDFTARFEVDHVNLRWITSTEHNNDFFAVERAGEDLKWKEILTVPGAGSSTSQLSYFEKDREPILGVSYYRLKQVDFDGTYTYSDVVSVLNTSARDEDTVFMYPNPAGSGAIFLRIPDATKIYDTKVRIFNLQGKVVWSGAFVADTNLMEVRYGNLTSGIYLVEIQSDVIYESKKLVIQ